MTGSHVAVIGLGSNLGDRGAVLASAIEALDWGDIRVTARSRVYETEPVGGPPDQPWFLNQVITVATPLDPLALWERCSAVEAALGRTRDGEPRWGPRIVDLDLLLYDDLQRDDDPVVLPHPAMHERAFVLVPLLEIMPEAVVPGKGPARALLDALSGPVVRPAT